MNAVVVDTNVARTANGDAEQAGPGCVSRCIDELTRIGKDRQLLLDDAGLILLEYLKASPYSSPRGPGDLFIVWVNDNQANPTRVRTVPVTPLDDPRGFAEFPEDPDLQDFDRDDRKFVATALNGGSSVPILNATDTDWWEYAAPLKRNGVRLEFLCPELMHDRK